MMQTGLRVVVGLALLALSALPAAAQNDRSWGLLFAYPGSVGVQWDASDRFALRVDADYAQSKIRFTSDNSDLPYPIPLEPSTSTSSTAFGSIGLSSVFTVHAANPLKLYVAPRVALTMHRNSSSATASFILVSPDLPSDPIASTDTEPETETNYGFDVSAKFGASYRLGERFAVFGETGVAYQRDSPSAGVGFNLRSSSIGLRAGVGGILYF